MPVRKLKRREVVPVEGTIVKTHMTDEEIEAAFEEPPDDMSMAAQMGYYDQKRQEARDADNTPMFFRYMASYEVARSLCWIEIHRLMKEYNDSAPRSPMAIMVDDATGHTAARKEKLHDGLRKLGFDDEDIHHILNPEKEEN